MARRMQTPRTGKRSKKTKERRKSKPKEADEVKKSSAELGDPAVGEGAEPAKIELQDSETEEGSNGKPRDTDEGKDLEQSEHDLEGKEGEGEREEGEGEMEDEEREIKGEEEGGEMEEEREEGGDGESDDDDAPEDITLAEGKTMALEKQKDEGEQIKRVKASAKQKRKKKYELFKKQKAAKQLRKVTKFSEEGLEIVAQKMAEERAMTKVERKKKKRQAEAGDPNQDAPEPSEVEVGGVRVVALGEESSRGRSITLRTAAGYEEASDFLKQSLYGGRQKRIPALSLQAKRYRNQPAKNFVHTANHT